MFIKTTNGTSETYTIGQLRRDNPHTSFPKDIPADVLEGFGVHKVKQTPAPEIDNKTHRHVQTVELVDGEWTQVWQVVQLFLDHAVGNIRAHRNHLLSDTDWIVSHSYEIGEPVPVEWASYRQQLRNITAQAGFPYEVIWPTKPE
jgi:hypothetical protein